MKNKMINLIKLATQDNTKLNDLENIYALYDQLQYCRDLNEMVSDLFVWLENTYSIRNLNFSLYDIDKNEQNSFLSKGEKFFLDNEFSSFFIINTHTDLNAVISFNVNDKEEFALIEKNRNAIDVAFFQISPILQTGIVKMHHVESSSIDSVTNVHNREYLIKHIDKIFEISGNKKEKIVFLMISIDRFKAIIEEFDYAIADKVLVELAKVIYNEISSFDIVARLTGNEFVVALTKVKNDNQPQIIAKTIIDKFAKTMILVDKDTKQMLQKTICIGISSYPKDGDTITQVIKNSDNFLSEAKNKGRSKFAIFSKEEESPLNLF